MEEKFQKTNRNIHYHIEDNFLRIWFRYVYRYNYMLTVCFYEVKRQAKDVVIGIVKEKAEHFFQATGKFKKYNIEYKGLSMEDM